MEWKSTWLGCLLVHGIKGTHTSFPSPENYVNFYNEIWHHTAWPGLCNRRVFKSGQSGKVFVEHCSLSLAPKLTREWGEKQAVPSGTSDLTEDLQVSNFNSWWQALEVAGGSVESITLQGVCLMFKKMKASRSHKRKGWRQETKKHNKLRYKERAGSWDGITVQWDCNYYCVLRQSGFEDDRSCVERDWNLLISVLWIQCLQTRRPQNMSVAWMECNIIHTQGSQPHPGW